MNLLLLQPKDFLGDGTAAISDQRCQHIVKVLRAKVGDTLKAGLLNGDIGNATITSLSSSSVTLSVALNTAPPAKLPLTLLLALPRPKMARRIIRAATELGVSEFILLNSYRVDKSYWQSPLLSDQALHSAMLEGLEQAGDTMLPTLSKAKLFKPFVEDTLPGLLHSRQGYLAHPYATAKCPSHIDQPSLLAVGPEGGFIPYEVEKLQATGLSGFSLGPRILKVETAVPTLIGKMFASI